MLQSQKAKVLEKQLFDQDKEVKFCKKRVMSDQRLRIILDEEGVCSVCKFSYEKNI